jgi:hypothetical protein
MLIKDGQKLNLEIRTWTNSLMADKKFLKASDDKKEAMIAAYNAGIMAGTTPVASSYPMTYLAKKSDAKDGAEYALRTTIADKNYFSYVVCKDDTLYLARNRGPIEMPDSKGGIYGFTIQGVQKIPMKLKVGDMLPPYEDISIITPQTSVEKVQIKVFSHNATNTTSEFGFATDSRTGESGFGNYTKTTTSAVYNLIDVDVRKTLKSSAHYLNYAIAKATGEEDVVVGASRYKAIVIESENWSKSVLDASFESATEQANREAKSAFEKYEVYKAKLAKRWGYTNELGYTVMYKKEWFVPGLGMVKTESYDPFGGIASQTLIAGLQ